MDNVYTNPTSLQKASTHVLEVKRLERGAS